MTGLRNLVAACAAALALGACTNLTAVRDFADSSRDIAQYDVLVADYVAFPARQKRYQPEGQHATLEQLARARAAQKDGLVALQAALAEYMDALGDLADDARATYDGQLDPLGKAAASAQFVAPTQAAAVSGIAGLLVQASLGGWRRSQVSTLIAEGNGPVQTICANLKQLAEGAFRGDIQRERDTVRLFFRDAESETQPRERAVRIVLEDLRDRRFAELDAKLAVADSYAKAVERIAAGHQRLYDARGDIDRDELISALKRNAKELRALGAQLRPLLPI